MPIPSISLDEALQQFAQRFRELLSKPQYLYFVTVLMGLMLCEGARTLQGLLRQIAARPGLAGLSRFLAEAPWEAAAVALALSSHMEATISTFESVTGTLTHVLLDSWYSAKRHGPAARQRGFLITTGLK